MPFACSRTIIEFESAWITSAFIQPGFEASEVELLTTIGADVVCPDTGGVRNAATAASAAIANISEIFIERNFQ